ncbi:MAG: site-specific DNA-methyltransferase [Alphaproteobacteria bacterium]|nr:site-specific DNA-methyltransferase [Alphaproteobacteria bacterium]
MKLDTIIHGDCLKELKKIPEKSVDMVFADPPYFMQTSGTLNRSDGTKFSGIKESWDKFDNLHAYDDFCRTWLGECRRILKKNGTIWVIGSFQNIYRLGYLMQEMGFWILNDVVWTKPNAPPNFTGTRLQNRHETLLWCSPKKGAPYTFNYQTLKALNAGKQENSVWNIGICIGPERLKDSEGHKLHATQKPEKLLTKIILASTKPGAIVLDPFMGTGTTGAVAKLLGRHFIGIEKDEKYISPALERISKIKPVLNEITQLEKDKKKPKVLFSKIIKEGILSVGEYLYTPDKKKVKILPNGQLKKGRLVGSIHQLAAILQNKSVANGWDYWNIKIKNEYKSIDILRKKK